MKILKYIILTLMTNNPSKKFSRYVVLMFAFLKVNKFITKQIKRKLYYDFHCDISQYCSIDDSVVFVHPVAVVIGSKAVIEKKCFIYQCVTLGLNFDSDNSMPHIMEGTKVGAGAKIIGGIVIGKNCLIGANAVVTKSVPDNSVVMGFNQIKPKNMKEKAEL